MGTFLTTSKMSPALAARVEASVRGRNAKAGRPRSRRLKSVVRAALVLAIAWVVTAAVRAKQHETREREDARATLLDAARAEMASVTDEDRKSVARVEALLLRLSSAPAPDQVANELRTPEGLRALLARPAVYIRGPLVSFTSAAGINEVATESGKDSLLACLFDPPASRTEKVVLAKVRAAYPGSTNLEDLTANVRRVGDARTGLPFLSPPWIEGITAARDVDEIEKLSARFKKAPLKSAKQALHAEVLIVAMDDTASGTGPTELDGARAHDVRFAVADIRSATVLVSLKKHVDPSWISMGLRAEHASKLDSCVLAMDLREALAARR